MRRWLLVGVIAAGVVVGVGFIARAAVFTALGAALIADEPCGDGEIIVVLSGSVPDRILEAVDLFRARKAPRILLSREGEGSAVEALRAHGGDMPTRHDINLSIAQQLGVPRDAIVVSDGVATSTFREAELMLATMRQLGVRRALLVTSKLHSRRTAMTFRALAGADIQFTVCPSRYDDFAPTTWWHNRVLLRRVFFEYQKLLVFQLWERWRGASLTAESA